MMPSIRPLGDSAAIVQWDEDDKEILRSVRQLTDRLWRLSGTDSASCISAIVPAFRSVVVHFELGRISYSEAAERIRETLKQAAIDTESPQRLIEIPVCFDAPFASDLDEVAQFHGIEKEELIRRFCDVEYSVRMIGFSPGFPYLSGLPPELETPRRSSPRLKVPQGSVAIGGCQAGIYSLETPGGWNIIGRTPVRLFTAELAQPCLLMAGDRVRFVRIRAEQFDRRQDE